MGKILCFIGLHSWIYDERRHDFIEPARKCSKCKKEQHYNNFWRSYQ